MLDTVLSSYIGSMLMAVLLTSLGLSCLNRFKPMKETHDGILIAVMALVFTLATMSYEGLEKISDAQGLFIKIVFTGLTSYLFSVTRGQKLVDKYLDKVLKKLGGDDDQAPPSSGASGG